MRLPASSHEPPLKRPSLLVDKNIHLFKQEDRIANFFIRDRTCISETHIRNGDRHKLQPIIGSHAAGS